MRLVGEYYAVNPAGKGKIKKPYDITVNVPKLEGCHSLIKNKLLKAALTRKYPDFSAPRGAGRIESAIPLNAATPKSQNLAYMDRHSLEVHVQGSHPRIPIDLTAYADGPEGTIALREAVIDYVQNPEGFAEREAERQANRAEAAALAALNPELAAEGV